MLETIITIGVPALVGFAGAWLTFKVNIKKADSDSDATYRDQLLRQVQELSDRLSEVEEKYKKAADELIEIKMKNAQLEVKLQDNFNHVAIMQSLMCHMPNPAWLKKQDGVMFFINSSYEREWGISKLKYEGRKDSDVWPSNVAEEFKKNDMEVISEMKGIHFIERVPNDPVSPNATYTEWDVWKFPVVYKGELVGIGGIASKR